MHAWCNDISDICLGNDGRCEPHLTTDLYWRKFRHLSASRCFGPSLKSGTAVAFAKCQKNWNGIEDQAAPQILWNTHSPLILWHLFYCLIMFPLFQFVLKCIDRILLCWVVLVFWNYFGIMRVELCCIIELHKNYF